MSQGYYNNAEATKNAIDDEGFYKTGDIGFFNDEGFLFIVDRKKDIMKYKGYQFNPSEIENVIENIEGVKLVAVVGIPDSIGSDLPTAVVVRQKGFQTLSEESVIAHVAKILPDNKHLHGGVFFIDEMPLTPNGKIQKKIVIELVEALKVHKKS